MPVQMSLFLPLPMQNGLCMQRPLELRGQLGDYMFWLMYLSMPSTAEIALELIS